jgi:tripartite-type tricarboxylate transporter receptor subunit TctC
MEHTRRRFLGPILGALLPAWASAQPASILTILVGFPGGSGPDILARRTAERLKIGMASTVVVDNRTGAGGQLAITALKSMPADGSAIVLTPAAMLTVYPHTYRRLPYDPRSDLAPLSMAVSFDVVFAVGPGVPASVRSLEDYFRWVRQNPTLATYGSPAAGSPLHFTPIALGRAAGVELTHVAYRGSVAAIPDLLAGRLPALCTPVGEVLAHLGEDKVRVLATSGATRSRFLPNVPTLAEQGFAELSFSEWFGFFAPAGTPEPTVARLNAALRQALSAPGFADALVPMGLEPRPGPPAELAASVSDGLRRWGPIVRAIGFTADS